MSNKVKYKIGATLMGVGVLQSDCIVITKFFEVKIPDKLKDEISQILIRHYGSIEDMLKIKVGIPLGEQYPKKYNEVKEN